MKYPQSIYVARDEFLRERGRDPHNDACEEAKAIFEHVIDSLPGHAAGAAAKGRKTLRKQLGAEVRKQFGIGILAWLLGWGLSALAQAIIDWIIGRLTTDKSFGAACQAYRMGRE